MASEWSVDTREGGGAAGRRMWRVGEDTCPSSGKMSKQTSHLYMSSHVRDMSSSCSLTDDMFCHI